MLTFLEKNEDSKNHSAFEFYIGSDGLGISINKKSTRWSTWSEYSECSVSCGDGISTRTRECINGSTGHRGCEIGGTIEQISCSKEKCAFWSTWSKYSDCTVTCGDGVKTRTRECINGSAGSPGCEIGETFEQISCRKEKCAFWSAWSEYRECSVTCGDGISTRTRECINGSAGHHGCEIGETIEQISCSKEKCAFWSTWSKYSDCTVTCGDGTRIRTRECINGLAGNPGCKMGETFEQVSCRKEKCAFWTTWSKYSDCSVTCGNGVKTRTRECINGSAGEDGCQVGETVEQKSCSKEKCLHWGKEFDNWFGRLVLEIQKWIYLLTGLAILLIWLFE